MNTYFDKIYILNLEERKDRWESMKKKLKKNNIYNFIRFSAIPGKKEPYYSLYRKLNFFDSPGAFGVLLSAYNIILHAIHHKYKRICILEDDILFHKHFNVLFEEKISKIPNNWKLLFLGSSIHAWRYRHKCKINKDFIIPEGSIPGAFALGIDCTCYRYLIEEIRKCNSAWDLTPIKSINKRFYGHCYILNPNLIIADTRDSDIREGKSLELKSKKCLWNLYEYDL